MGSDTVLEEVGFICLNFYNVLLSSLKFTFKLQPELIGGYYLFLC